MIKKARTEGGLPNDIYSKAEGHCNDATMTKVMFADHSKIMRHPAAISEANLGECYDRMANPPTSLAMQSWGPPKNSAKIVLTALRLMQFCIRTGFGESPEPFGGTEDRPFRGGGQDSGWAPPGFVALSSIMINAYKRAGCGAEITSSYFSRVFLLAAVMYVDDTNLLHWAESPEMTDEELIKTFQWELDV